jgi:signal transduction histidine kinase
LQPCQLHDICTAVILSAKQNRILYLYPCKVVNFNLKTLTMNYFYSLLFSLLCLCYLPLFTQAQSVEELKELISASEGAEKIKLLSDLSWELSFINQDEAIEYGMQAAQLAMQFKDDFLLSDAYNSVSNAYYNKGDYYRAIEYNYKALDIRKAIADSSGMASSYSKLAMSYFEINQYEKSLEYNLFALRIFEKLGNMKGAGYTLNNIGSVYKMMRLYDKAAEYHKAAIKLAKEREDDYGVAKAMANLAIIYQYQEKFDSAVAVNLSALEIFESYNTLQDITTLHLNLGVLYRTMGNTPQGLEHYLKALYYNQKAGDKNNEAYILSNLGFINISLGNYAASEIYFNQSLEVAREIDLKNIILKSMLGTLELKLIRGNLKDQIPLLENILALKDTIFDEESFRAIAEMSTRYETEKKEREIVLQQLEIEKQAAELSRRNLMLGSSLVILIVLVVLAYLIYNRQKLKQKHLETEIALKEEIARKELQKSISEERLRISRDLHDSLGAELTLITASADNLAMQSTDDSIKQGFDEISDISRNSVSILRDTIWAIRKDTLDVAEFATKLIQFVNQRKNHIEVDVVNEVSESIELTPGQSLHLFRVCQEAVHNAIKHAECSKMTIFFSNDHQNIYVKIQDNGKGFEGGRKGGYGLKNMQERISEINGSISIESAPGKGTEINIQLGRKV